MDSLVSQLESQQELGHLLVLEGQPLPQVRVAVAVKFSSSPCADQLAAWLRPGQLEASGLALSEQRLAIQVQLVVSALQHPVRSELAAWVPLAEQAASFPFLTPVLRVWVQQVPLEALAKRELVASAQPQVD